MSKFTDQNYLLSDQYKDARNLKARIQLHQQFSTNKTSFMSWIFDLLRLPLEATILDIGCGPGDLWRENLTRIPSSWEIILSDLSIGMLQKSINRPSLHHQRFEYCLSDVQALPIQNDCFDAVIANFMLYHVPDRRLAFSEIQRVLKPGGQLYAATNGENHMVEIRELIRGIDPDAYLETAASEFGLENGAQQLNHQFSDVQLYRRDNALVVTETEPLVAYILSLQISEAIQSNPEPLISVVSEQIALEGAVKIQKDVGLFVAQKSL